MIPTIIILRLGYTKNISTRRYKIPTIIILRLHKATQ